MYHPFTLILNTPLETMDPWFSKEIPHNWEHLWDVKNIRVMGLVGLGLGLHRFPKSVPPVLHSTPSATIFSAASCAARASAVTSDCTGCTCACDGATERRRALRCEPWPGESAGLSGEIPEKSQKFHKIWMISMMIVLNMIFGDDDAAGGGG